MQQLRLAVLGFGNVGRALAALLVEKQDELGQRYDLAFSFSGGYTRSAGGWQAAAGLAPAALLPSGWPGGSAGHVLPAHAPAGAEVFAGDALAFAARCPADILLELTTLNPLTGEPATGHIQAALAAGRHVVTANKGPIAHAYRELSALAAERGVALRFESTVMDGTPLFGMAEAALPATTITGLCGLLNSTSNYVLGRMAAGASLEEAVAGAQRLGVAEADPSFDLEGWDAAVKATVLANVLMGADLRPADVRREGLGATAMRRAHAGLLPGQTLKQVVEVERTGNDVVARVRLAALPPGDLFAQLSGMEAALLLHTDTMQDLTIVEGEGGPGQTAFGVLADAIAIARAARH
jgi:homoserine dehydrogenase